MMKIKEEIKKRKEGNRMDSRKGLQCKDRKKDTGKRDRRKKKKSKEMINKQGEELIRWMREEGWRMMNRAKEGDNVCRKKRSLTWCRLATILYYRLLFDKGTRGSVRELDALNRAVFR